MSQRIKIVVVGAQESGKSCLSNFMAGARDLVGLPYAPTAALRILEFDCKVSAGSSLYEENVSIELWDTSGDTQYQTTWPAIGQDMNGVILVCNPGKERELEFWWKSFVEPSVKRGNLHENCCLILAHRKSTENMNKSQMQIPRQLSKFPIVETNLDIPSDKLFEEFDLLISRILENVVMSR